MPPVPRESQLLPTVVNNEKKASRLFWERGDGSGEGNCSLYEVTNLYELSGPLISVSSSWLSARGSHKLPNGA